MSGKGFDSFFIFSISILAFTMLVELMIEKDLRSLINALFINYFILISINLFHMISIFGFTVNIEDNATELFNFYSENSMVSLLASVNGTASFLFPALCSAILLMLSTNKKNLIAWLLIIEILTTVLILWSATSLVGVFLIVSYILFVYDTPKVHKIRYKTIVSVVVLLGLGITFFKIQNLFSFIIVDILHKDLTMTGRTNVWNIGFDGFFSSPFIGCGYSATTIDNGYIQLLYIGGILGTICYSVFLYKIIKRICNKKASQLECFFSVVIAVVLLMFIAESWPRFIGLYIILAFAVNAKKIELELSKNINLMKR